jgi:predicted nucleic acid-binding protein
MVLVDTTVGVDYLNGVVNAETAWLRTEFYRQPIGLTDLILCELLQGLKDDRQVESSRRALAGCVIFDSGGEAMAIASALNYRRLRVAGITVRKTIDCVIATYCIRNGHTLLHRDRDFDGFERHLGLKVVHPAPLP